MELAASMKYLKEYLRLLKTNSETYDKKSP